MKKVFVTLLSVVLLTQSMHGSVGASVRSGVFNDINPSIYIGYAGITKEIRDIREDAQENYIIKQQKKFKKASKNIVTKYTNCVCNIREEANTDSAILKTVYWNTQVEGFEYEGWFYLDNGCIRIDLLNDNPVEYTEIDAPWNSGWKSWMPYDTITATGSLQYKIQHTVAYTGNYGIRQVNGRYCVALGSYFGCSIGQYFDLVLENGEVIPCVMSDAKANCDTDVINATSRNGCMSEFIIDRYALDSRARSAGTVGAVSDLWKSPISSVRVYRKNVLE